MIIITQFVIVLVAIVIVLKTLGTRHTHSGKAWKKIALVLLALMMIVAVLLPELTNDVARFVGVGRGADLLLYATVTAFILYALNNYLYQQDQRDALYRLARKIALVEANDRYNIYADKASKNTAKTK
jgi:hypothetical protein